MKIIIIGSGMGGMTAALALRNFGHEVDVYERVEKLLPVGAAISVWSNGIKCLNFIGVGERAKALGGSMTSMAYLDGMTGDTMCDFSLAPLVEEVGEAGYPIARAELQDMLHDAFGAEHLHLGKECVAIADDGEHVTASFADGSTATADVLIGADGTHSFTREYVLDAPTPRRYAGYVNWNCLVPASADLAPPDRWTTWVADGKRVSLMPVGGERFYFFFDVPLPAGLPNERDTYRETLHDAFAGWDSRVHRLIDALDPATTNRVEIHDIDPWHEWVRGRVALMGDAAHSTTPDIGQGGCQAMEDGVAVAIALQVNGLGVEDALLRYQRQRSERAAEWVLRARKRCDVTHGVDPAATQAWYEELRSEDGTRTIAGIAANIHGSPVG